MAKNWKDIIGAVAPALATALGGPLAGVAVDVLGKAILGKEGSSESDIQEAILQGLSPETMARLEEANLNFKLEIEKLVIEGKRLDYQNDREYLLDTQSARQSNSDKEEVFWVGIVVLVMFGVIATALTIGSWALLTGGLGTVDPATVGLVFGFLGTVLGYVASNAQQVINFWFGTSKGSQQKTDAMVSAINKIPTK